MSLTRYALQVGALSISTYALVVLVALVTGGIITRREARRHSERGGPVLDLLGLGLASAVVFGRALYILSPPPSAAAYYDRQWYLTHFFDLQAGPLAIWSGGLDAAGMWIGAALAAVYVVRRERLNTALWADILTPGALALLAVSAWANVANGQLFGPPTALPWGMGVERRPPPFDDLALYPLSTRFHPTPAYLSIWALVTLAIVLLIGGRRGSRLRRGDRALLALAIYLPGLFAVDFLRVDVSRVLLGLTGVQVLAAAALLGVALFGAGRLRRGIPAPD
jgi:phosphatidylglycerol:prolipoprotein diacylglycerol transferase